VVPFLLGTIVGGVAGAVAGTLLCDQTTSLAAAVLDLIDRRVNADERERLRFDLMLQ
jgi:gas vesicle protein